MWKRGKTCFTTFCQAPGLKRQCTETPSLLHSVLLRRLGTMGTLDVSDITTEEQSYPMDQQDKTWCLVAQWQLEQKSAKAGVFSDWTAEIRKRGRVSIFSRRTCANHVSPSHPLPLFLLVWVKGLTFITLKNITYWMFKSLEESPGQ